MTEQDKQRESMAIFMAGQLMGVASGINAEVLENFINSDRSKGDFRYLKECIKTLNYVKDMNKP